MNLWRLWQVRDSSTFKLLHCDLIPSLLTYRRRWLNFHHINLNFLAKWINSAITIVNHRIESQKSMTIDINCNQIVTNWYNLMKNKIWLKTIDVWCKNKITNRCQSKRFNWINGFSWIWNWNILAKIYFPLCLPWNTFQLYLLNAPYFPEDSNYSSAWKKD